MKALRKQDGFTLIELMIVVVIIGILASIAIPNFLKFQLRSKSAEGPSNVGAIQSANAAFNSKWGSFVVAQASPGVAGLGDVKQAWAPVAANGFNLLGWEPTGDVFFAYCVVAGAPTASAAVGAAPANACAAVDSALNNVGGRPTVVPDEDLVFHFGQADIDATGNNQGYYNQSANSDIFPDPLDSGENQF